MDPCIILLSRICPHLMPPTRYEKGGCAYCIKFEKDRVTPDRINEYRPTVVGILIVKLRSNEVIIVLVPCRRCFFDFH